MIFEQSLEKLREQVMRYWRKITNVKENCCENTWSTEEQRAGKYI